MFGEDHSNWGPDKRGPALLCIDYKEHMIRLINLFFPRKMIYFTDSSYIHKAKNVSPSYVFLKINFKV